MVYAQDVSAETSVTIWTVSCSPSQHFFFFPHELKNLIQTKNLNGIFRGQEGADGCLLHAGILLNQCARFTH